MVNYGRVTPAGRLPVFSTKTAECAAALIEFSCETNCEGEHVARELAEEQTLENLQAFSDRLAMVHEIMVERGGCKCRVTSPCAPDVAAPYSQCKDRPPQARKAR